MGAVATDATEHHTGSQWGEGLTMASDYTCLACESDAVLDPLVPEY